MSKADLTTGTALVHALSRRIPDQIGLSFAAIADRSESLFPIERSTVQKAVPKRVEEFSTGRWLAREALKKRNLPTGAIPTGSAREPLWPNGAIGSISHSTPLCGVAIAHANQYRGIGLDLEMAKPPDRDLGTLILSEVERRDYLEAPWLQVVFSAKEAVYKGVYPILHKFLDFHDVAIHLDREAKTFSASARCDAVRTIVASGSGIYELDDSGVATLFTIPADT